MIDIGPDGAIFAGGAFSGNILLPTCPVVERCAVSFSYPKDAPDDLRQLAWADAKRQLAGDVFSKLYPNRDYIIRYRELTSPSVLGSFYLDGIIEATITYR